MDVRYHINALKMAQKVIWYTIIIMKNIFPQNNIFHSPNVTSRLSPF